MCLGLVGRVVELVADRPGLALVDIAGVRRPVNVGLLEAPDAAAEGSWVLVHMGFALQTLTEDEAAEALSVLDSFTAEREAIP
jgi:hydrogenase expression/formation protein HypC